MKKIRIAQIGINQHSHSTELFYSLKMLSDVFEIVGYTLVEDEREVCADKLDCFEGYPELTLDEILTDKTIEAVAVETDEIHLTKYAIMAAEAGKHIHMEKPGSQNASDFERLIEIVRRNGKTFHIGYMYRYNPLISDAIARVRAGEFGSIFSVEAHMSRCDALSTREWFGSFKGGMMFFLGCHLIDLVMQIQGAPANVIPLSASSGLDGVNTEDIGFAVLKYPNGVSVVRASGTEIGGFNRRELVICGSKGTLVVRPLEVLVPDEIRHMVYTEQTEYRLYEGRKAKAEFSRSPAFQRYEAMLNTFASIVRGEQENPNTLDYELELYRVILKCCGV